MVTQWAEIEKFSIWKWSQRSGLLGDRMRIFLLTNLRRSVALVKITSTKMSKTSEMTEATKPAAKNAAQPTMAEVV